MAVRWCGGGSGVAGRWCDGGSMAGRKRVGGGASVGRGRRDDRRRRWRAVRKAVYIFILLDTFLFVILQIAIGMLWEY